jgi:hypothetical protein
LYSNYVCHCMPALVDNQRLIIKLVAVHRCEELAKLQAATSTASDDLAGQLKVLAAAQQSAQAGSRQAFKLLGRELRSELEGLRFGGAQQKEAAAAEAAVVALQLEAVRLQPGCQQVA